MSEKPVKEIDVESLDAELAAAREIEKNKNTFWGKLTALFALAMAIFHIVTVFYPLGVIPQRGIHTAFAFTILFLSMPISDHLGKRLKANAGFKKVGRVIDVGCVIAFWAAIYMCCYEYDHLADHLGIPTMTAAVAGAILLVLVLEGTRRCLGNIMPILASLFVVYALVGQYIPGRLGHRGYSFVKICQYLAVDLDGIFGTTISVSAGTIFMFVMFGAFLEASGCSQFINDLALSLTGKLRCGPALAAVVASALMGCINGSAVANVVGTGTFTIPLMKSRGYSSEFASGVESVASTGGQILPPVMGSGAFLMVVFTLVPYSQIVVAALVPAILYFLGAGIAVYAQGEIGDVQLLPEDQIPKTGKVLREGWFYLVIIAVLVYCLLIAQFSPARSALYACVSVPVVMVLDKKKRFPISKIPAALVKSGYSALSVVSGCACAGIVVAMVSRTGLGVVFGDAMISAARGNLFLSLVFTAMACIILGMGLPTTSAYVIAAAILAPALVKLGLSLLTAHLFVFYFACLSAITPPVALAAYAGAGIAGCDPMKTAINACKIGFAGFIVPFVFCYNSAMMLDGTLPQIAMVCGTALVGCIGMSCGMQGWYFSGQRKIPAVVRILVIGAGLCMMIPIDILSLVGLVILIGLAVIEMGKNKKAKAAA